MQAGNTKLHFKSLRARRIRLRDEIGELEILRSN